MLIHIGYHKTGTTFLQTGLFSSPAAGFCSPWPHSDIRRDIVLCSDFDWDPMAVAERYTEGIAAAEDAGLVAVMSDERLSGSPHAGGFDSANIARRLAQVFPDAKVVIGIREQVDAIHSTYQQYVRNGGGARIDKYLEPRHQAEVPQFRFDHWQYDRLVGLYQGLFGPQRVLTLAYEHLKSNSATWVEQIQDLADVPLVEPPSGDRYPSLSPAGIGVKRHANRILFRGALNPAAPLYVRDLETRFERIDRFWPAALSRRVDSRRRETVRRAAADKYDASNRRTSKLAGIDLGQLGYSVGEA